MALPQRTVLILDTDEATGRLYRRELRHRCQMLQCTTEQAAWQMLHTQRVDAIILEPTALHDESWGFVARLRASTHHRDTPIIVCSTLDARRHGAELGVSAYLIKPVTPQALDILLQRIFAWETAPPAGV